MCNNKDSNKVLCCQNVITNSVNTLLFELKINKYNRSKKLKKVKKTLSSYRPFLNRSITVSPSSFSQMLILPVCSNKINWYASNLYVNDLYEKYCNQWVLI